VRAKELFRAGGLTCQAKELENMALWRQQVVVRLTAAQALRCEELGECLWPAEKLSVEGISRRLLLEYLLWAAGRTFRRYGLSGLGVIAGLV
jgi:hypothetical protein